MRALKQWFNLISPRSRISFGTRSFLVMDSIEYPCLCGQRMLSIRTTRKGVNQGRKYLSCPDIPCGLYSFLDELRMCQCGHGYCRNTWVKTKAKGNVKYWCCPLKGNNACGFRMSVTRQGATPSQESQAATTIQESQPSSSRRTNQETLVESVHISLDVIQRLAKKLQLDLNCNLNDVSMNFHDVLSRRDFWFNY